MAFSLALQRLSLIVAILVIATPHLASAQDPLQIIGKAILCFDNQTVYNDCGKAIRSSINGTVNGTVVICSKSCLAEAFLILDCVDQILSNFVFYNNMTIPAVKATFKAACNNINITVATNTSGLTPQSIGTTGRLSSEGHMTLSPTYVLKSMVIALVSSLFVL
ncbi:hypothetical protein QJS10_CPA05g00269 [Acorus calamus]|uniref:DUF7731 domain-containing protein n=1 Tax=Acorus calamus TaxID=4465 RepID=A0AAV9EUH3_ACOCL|nr:hypothetical protein QJS10_CPA05g00269 [Acorus calamus]